MKKTIAFLVAVMLVLPSLLLSEDPKKGEMAVQATDSKGVTYTRVAPTQFPSNAKGDSALVHRITSYNKRALWDSVQAWFEGGPVVIGRDESTDRHLVVLPEYFRLGQNDKQKPTWIPVGESEVPADTIVFCLSSDLKTFV